MSQQSARLSAFVLRVTLGACFVAHGGAKVIALFGDHGSGTWVGQVKALGLEPALLFAILVAAVELLAGAALVLGMVPRLAAAAIAVVMAAAIWLVHGRNGFFASNHGFEYNLALIAMAASVMMTGPGAYALRLRSQKEA